MRSVADQQHRQRRADRRLVAEPVRQAVDAAGARGEQIEPAGGDGLGLGLRFGGRQRGLRLGDLPAGLPLRVEFDAP